MSDTEDRFRDLKAKALAGDIDAANALPEALAKFLDEARGPVSDRIEPALSPEEWYEYETRNSDGSWLGVGRMPGTIEVRFKERSPDGSDAFSAAKAIALANDAFPDSDPRKISWEWVDALRSEAERGEFASRTGDNAGFSAIDPWFARQMADALESYLPPRETKP